MEEFHRIRRLPPYVFEQVNRVKAIGPQRRRRHHRSRHGQSRPAGAAHVIEKLKDTLGKPRTDRYSASKGIAGLRRAQAAYYERRFGVRLNPDTQIVATLGSKEGFANVAQAITAPGDVDPGAEPELSDPRLRLPDGGRRDPLGSLGARRRSSSRRWSARSSTRSRSRSASWSAIRPTRRLMSRTSISTATWSPSRRRHDIFILSDLAYAEVYFDGMPPPSVLQVPGAMDVTVEFTSMSKTFSMPGWRMGSRSAMSASSRRWRG